MRSPERLSRLLRFIFLVFLTITLFLIINDAMGNWSLIEGATFWLLAPAILFGVLDVTVDFFVWYFYLTRVKKDVGFNSSLMIFLAGFATDLAPAKMGELSRSVFLSIINGIPARQGVGIQLNSLLVDFCSAVFIGMIGLGLLKFWTTAAIIIIFSFMFLYIFFRVIKYEKLLPVLQRIFRRFLPPEIFFGIPELQESIRSLLKPRYYLLMVPFKTLSWLSTGMVLFYLSRAFGYPLGYLESLFAVTLSALFGAFSMIPNGLGVTEASLAGFQVFLGVPMDVAVIVAFVCRGITMWSWILIGNAIGQIMSGRIAVLSKTRA